SVTRRELFFAAIALLLLASVGFGANFFAGQTVAPMDLLAQGQGYSEGLSALAMHSPQKTDILDGLLPSWRFARSELRQGRLPWHSGRRSQPRRSVPGCSGRSRGFSMNPGLVQPASSRFASH